MDGASKGSSRVSVASLQVEGPQNQHDPSLNNKYNTKIKQQQPQLRTLGKLMPILHRSAIPIKPFDWAGSWKEIEISHEMKDEVPAMLKQFQQAFFDQKMPKIFSTGNVKNLYIYIYIYILACNY